MTHNELAEYTRVLFDKYQSPWFDDAETSTLLNTAYYEWLKLKVKKFEVDGEIRRSLINLTIKDTVTATAVIDLDDLSFEYYRVIALAGTWDFECNNITTRRTVPIKPISWDDYYRTNNDPFNKAEDAFPLYVELFSTVPQLEIKSTTVPLSVDIVYLKMPVRINLPTTANTDIEVPDDCAREIAEFAVMKELGIVESPRQADQVQVQMPLAIQ